MTVTNKKLIEMSAQAKGVETRILDCGGRRIASVDGPNGSALDFYSVGRYVVIVQDFASHQGCEIYFSRTESQLKDIYAVIEEIAKA